MCTLELLKAFHVKGDEIRCGVQDPTTEYLAVSSWDELNLPKEIAEAVCST